MISEEDIDFLGNMLEDKGMSHTNIDKYFLEHHGVKGIRWGVRNNAKAQRRIDAVTRVSRGIGSKKDTKLLGPHLTKKRAQKHAQELVKQAVKLQTSLDKQRNSKHAIVRANAWVSDKMLQVRGLDIRQLNYHQNA